MADEGMIAVIVNPAAGSGRVLKQLPAVNAALVSLGVPFQLHLTISGEDAWESAAKYAREGASRVIAIGGDGTINQVANGILETGLPVALGIVAIGSGSDFARTIDAPKAIPAAVQRCCTVTPHPIDVGWAEFESDQKRAFINVLGMGFDALSAKKAQTTKMPGSNLPYLSSALSTLATFENFEVSVEVDGIKLSTKAVFVQIANAKFMGGGFKIAPMAELTDGLLDLALVGDLTKFELLRNLPKVYSGTHVSHPKFTHLRGKRFHIESEQPALVQAEGELIGTTPVTVTVDPGALLLAG